MSLVKDNVSNSQKFVGMIKHLADYIDRWERLLSRNSEIAKNEDCLSLHYKAAHVLQLSIAK